MFYSERFTFLVPRRRSVKSEQLARDNLGTESRSMARENVAGGGERGNQACRRPKGGGKLSAGMHIVPCPLQQFRVLARPSWIDNLCDQEWVGVCSTHHALGESHPLRREDPVNLLHAFTSQSKSATSNQLVDVRLGSGCFQGWGPWSVTKILFFYRLTTARGEPFFS